MSLLMGVELLGCDSVLFPVDLESAAEAEEVEIFTFREYLAEPGGVGDLLLLFLSLDDDVFVNADDDDFGLFFFSSFRDNNFSLLLCLPSLLCLFPIFIPFGTRARHSCDWRIFVVRGVLLNPPQTKLEAKDRLLCLFFAVKIAPPPEITPSFKKIVPRFFGPSASTSMINHHFPSFWKFFLFLRF